MLTIGTKETGGGNFKLPLDLTTQSIAILAKRGVGKSYTSAVFCEELLDAGQVPVIIDPTGAHWGLKSKADGKSAGYPVVIFGGEHGDLPLEEDKGEAIATAIVDQRFPAIIDLSLFRKGQVRRFMTPFLETLYRLNRLPLMLVVDEADDICPQKCGPEEAQMVGAMEDVVKRGRKKGLGCTLITQRPADLAKQVLTQCEMLVAMRLVHPLDIRAVMEWVNVHADKDTAAKMIESLPTLPIGTAWFWSPGWGDIFERVKIRPRRTFDSGATPKPGEKRLEPKEMAVIDLTALGEKITLAAARALENNPAHLRKEIAALKKQILNTATAAPVEKVVTVPILTDENLKVLDRVARSLDEIRQLQKTGNGIMESLGHEIVLLSSNLKTRIQPIATKRSEPFNPDEWAREGEPMFSLPMGETFKRKIHKPGPINRDEHLGESELPPAGSVYLKTQADRITTLLPKGELAVLTACAQHGAGGCTREQLTVLTGYKRSSRDAYIQRLKERALINTVGDYIVANAAGVAALGDDFEPLPTGAALRDYWLNNKLPAGESMILAILCKHYPEAVDRESISEQTGYKRSSRDAYLQRLSARRLVITTSQGVAASATLFS